MKSNKIQPLFPRQIIFRFYKSNKKLLKRHYKVSNALELDLQLRFSDYRKPSTNAFLRKFFKQTKLVNKLYLTGNLQDCAHSNYSSLIKLMKGLSTTTKSWNLYYSECDLHFAYKWYKVCLKFAKSLEKIDSREFYFSNTGDLDPLDRENFYKKFAGVFNQARLQTLNIFGYEPKLFIKSMNFFPQKTNLGFYSDYYIEEHCRKSLNTIKIWLKILDIMDEKHKYYCYDLCNNPFYMVLGWEYSKETVQHLQIWDNSYDFENLSTDQKAKSSLSDMTHLVSLEVDFPTETLKIIRILESTPDLSNLVALKIKGLMDSTKLATNVCPLLLKTSQCLEKLCLNFEKPVPSFLPYFEEFHNNGVLKEFKLTMPIDLQIQSIFSQLFAKDCFKGLLVLRIEGILCDTNNYSQVFWLILKNALKMEKLERMEINTLFSNEKDIEKNIITNFENEQAPSSDICFEEVFSKKITYKELKLHFDLEIPTRIEPLFINIIEKAQNLILLAIYLGKFTCTETGFKKILDSLKNLEQIEELRIKGPYISSNAALEQLMNCILSLKKLKIFEFGEITGDVDLRFFIKLMKEIFLGATTISKLCCSISKDLEKKILEDNNLQEEFEFLISYRSWIKNVVQGYFKYTNKELKWNIEKEVVYFSDLTRRDHVRGRGGHAPQRMKTINMNWQVV